MFQKHTYSIFIFIPYKRHIYVNFLVQHDRFSSVMFVCVLCGCVSVLCAWLEIHFCIFYNNQHIASPAHSPCGKVRRGIENKSLAFHTSLAFSGPRCQLFAQIIKIFSHECQHSPHLDWSPVAGRRPPIVMSACPLGQSQLRTSRPAAPWRCRYEH